MSAVSMAGVRPLPTARPAPPVAAAPQPQPASPDIPFTRDLLAGSSGTAVGGGLLSGIGRKLKSAMLYAAMGAAAGMVFPIIPGGPVGGALIGAAVSLLF